MRERKEPEGAPPFVSRFWRDRVGILTLVISRVPPPTTCPDPHARSFSSIHKLSPNQHRSRRPLSCIYQHAASRQEATTMTRINVRKVENRSMAWDKKASALVFAALLIIVSVTV